MLIYPNIVNMMGEMTVDVNALCLDRSQTYILMIEQRQVIFCISYFSALKLHRNSLLDCNLYRSKSSYSTMSSTESLRLGHEDRLLPASERRRK